MVGTIWRGGGVIPVVLRGTPKVELSWIDGAAVTDVLWNVELEAAIYRRRPEPPGNIHRQSMRLKLREAIYRRLMGRRIAPIVDS
jgi:hypothetical protein